jgi:flagellum-specific ATP synthase
MSVLFAQALSVARKAHLVELKGQVTEVTGLIVEASGPNIPVGSQVNIRTSGKDIPAQVVGFKKDKILLMPFSELEGLAPGAVVIAHNTTVEIPVSDALLGRVVDGFCNPIDNKPHPILTDKTLLYKKPPSPIERERVTKYFDVGVKAINAALTIGVGQRVGIMAGSGVGKSTLLGMIAKHAESDINVIGLIGERGREVREFIEHDLGPEGLKRSVIVVATGDQSALLRIRAANLATAIAEYFRDQGKRVVLMLDSVTRFAMAQREIGLAVGEPPSTKGYTPSVFSLLPKLLERAGNAANGGSITGIYTVLVEGDDMNEPIADATRGILDGHIVLSRRLAGRGHFPAIEILESASRVMNNIVSEQMLNYTSDVRDILARYKDVEDLISIGAYKEGNNPKLDRAVILYEGVMEFLKQKAHEKWSYQQTIEELRKVLKTK